MLPTLLSPIRQHHRRPSDGNGRVRMILKDRFVKGGGGGGGTRPLTCAGIVTASNSERNHSHGSEMDTSHIDKVKAPQHFKTPRSDRLISSSCASIASSLRNSSSSACSAAAAKSPPAAAASSTRRRPPLLSRRPSHQSRRSSSLFLPRATLCSPSLSAIWACNSSIFDWRSAISRECTFFAHELLLAPP